MVGGMFAPPPRCRPLPVPRLAVGWSWLGWTGVGWAAVLIALAGFAATAAPWAVRGTLAATAAVAAAAWGWRNGRGAWRGWIAAAPIAAWTIGTFGWSGAGVVAVTAWIALLRQSPSHAAQGPALHRGRTGSSRLEENRTSKPDELHEDALAQHEPEPDEPEPDQWFARTADRVEGERGEGERGAGERVEGELIVRCEQGVGSAHVLFWPALAGAPRVTCRPTDGIGRVRATRTLPQGVRFELTRPDAESGPVRVYYEAAV